MTAPGRERDREIHRVELVDDRGRAVGESTVDDAHRLPGRLHRAFSVMLRDADGRLLLQQRAAVKTRFPLRWANTCCGHPAPGADLAASAAARLSEEVGLSGVTLTPVGTFTYRAVDPETGRVEYEYDHVLLGEYPAHTAPAPDPAEVAALHWEDPEALYHQALTEPDEYAPWLVGVLSVIRQSVSGDGASARASQ